MAAAPNDSIGRLQLPIAPVSSMNGCDESRQTPIRIKQVAMNCRSPWRLGRPRRTLVPQRVQWVDHIPGAADALAPILGWLALRAIRISLQIGDGDTVSNSFALAVAPVCFAGLPVAVVTHAKQ